MEFTKRFYKTDEGRWYIDLPEWLDNDMPIEALEMIDGADLLLDKLSKYGNEVLINFSDIYKKESLHLKKIYEDKNGATYSVKMEDFVVWLCPVTLYLFENYPENLYIKTVKKL